MSECRPGKLKSPRGKEAHGLTPPSGGAPPSPPLLVPCRGPDNATFNKSSRILNAWFCPGFNGPWTCCLRYSQPFVWGSQLLKGSKASALPAV